jgi:hypothetical protein
MNKKLLTPLLFISSIFYLSSCYPLIQTHKLRIENDEVKKSTRYIYASSYNVLEKDEPVFYFGKTFFKEQDSLGNATTKVFDVIELNTSADKIDSIIYLVTDAKTFFILIKNTEKNIKKSIDKRTENIMKVDSTKVEIITDYDEYFYQIYKFNYLLTDEMIQEILKSKQIKSDITPD